MTDVHPEATADEDRLPWLEAVEEEDEGGGPSVAKLVAAVLIGLIAIGLVVGGLFWLGERGASNGDGELIAAPEGPYKVAPPDRGGLEVEGEGDTAFAASEGAEPKARLDVDALPEAPVTNQPPAKAEPKQAQAKQPQQPQQQAKQAAPAQQPAAAGATIQLGAFSSQAAANTAWKALSGRFSYLAPLSHSIIPVEAGERTLYRLRASGPGAADVCRRLRVAGEDCAVV